MDFLNKREFRKSRKNLDLNVTDKIGGETDLRIIEAIKFETMMEAEDVMIYPDDIFGFNRTQISYPHSDDESGTQLPLINDSYNGNLTLNYASVIGRGFDSIIDFCDERLETCEPSQKSFYVSVKRHLAAIEKIAERYRKEAARTGNRELASALEQIPKKPARSYYEACVFMRLFMFTLRAARNSHLTLGRFDQYMLPYFEKDLENGVSEERLFETTELFFISLNFDTDIYQGVQQGDNGQSMVLGGFDKDGKNMFNKLSEFCMLASRELCLIDPKINLRVGKNTPDELYELGTSLTKKGLGFPQYCNDDVVVPGLIALGYDPEDALNYTVAACWEYIVPNCGADIPNVATMNFPLVVRNATVKYLEESDTFGSFLEKVKVELEDETNNIMKTADKVRFGVYPYYSMFVDGCLEKGEDLSSNPAKYNNFGCHGAGIANGADALAAIKKAIYEEKSISKEDLLKAIECNFEGYGELRNVLLNCPKMGNNDDFVDNLAGVLMDVFTSTMNNKPNSRGGIWRAGTGSAMEYILSARQCPATADGRLAFTPYASSFSPAITTKLNGPLSVIQSFTKFDMKRIINGGPLTLEIHDTVFRNPEGEKKVSELVKAFVLLGGHQLQLNAVNRERLLDAKAHPENYPNLIVRVWGWSGYFCELDSVYQDHIIKRTEFEV